VSTDVLSLRADAARNRLALIEAARATFGRRGLDAPLDEIARTAGIGNATLYRHFPSRQALVGAVYADTLADILQACDRALALDDAWQGFASHVEYVCRLQADNRGLADLLTRHIDAEPAIERLRQRAYEAFVRIADRAKRSGELRADFQPEDLSLLLMANAGLIHRTADAAPGAWARFVAFVLDGLRNGSARTVAPPSPGRQAIRAAMASTASSGGERALPHAAPRPKAL